MLWRMARSSHSPSVWPSRWAAAIAAFLASAVTPRTDHGAGRGPFWQFSASIKSLQRKQCIIKKWSTQAYQKAYQIRPSPLRRKWSVQVAGAKRPATLPDWRNPGAECQRRRSRERSNPEPRTARRASMARIASTHPLTRRWAAPQLNKPTSGRQARPLKGFGALPGQIFMYIKTYLATRFAGPDRTRCMATYKCALRENSRTLFALVVSLKMRDLHSLVSQVELLLSPIGVAVFLHKPNAVAVEKQRGIYPIEVRVGALCDEPFWMSSRMAL